MVSPISRKQKLRKHEDFEVVLEVSDRFMEGTHRVKLWFET